jgi:hypothetical protein
MWLAEVPGDAVLKLSQSGFMHCTILALNTLALAESLH